MYRGNNKGQSKGGRVAKCLEKGYRMIAQIRDNIRGKKYPPIMGAAFTKVGRPSAAPPLWVPLWVGIFSP